MYQMEKPCDTNVFHIIHKVINSDITRYFMKKSAEKWEKQEN